jgi:hypothetical protein
MKHWSIIAVVAIAFAAVAAAPAPAATVADCQAQIATIQSELAQANAVTFFFGANAQKDLTGLKGKLSDAQTKVAQQKLGDAAQKLTDFQTKVSQLLAGRKIDATFGAMLLQQATDAIACVNSLVPATV